MACNSDSSITLPLGIGTVEISIETLSTALAVVTAAIYYSKWKDDKDNLKDLAAKYTAIGEEYCEAGDVLRANTNRYYEYTRATPIHQQSRTPALQSYHASLLKIGEKQQQLNRTIPSDSVGVHCEVQMQTAKHTLLQGTAAWVEGMRYTRQREDKSLASYQQAVVNAVAGSTPNLGSVFNLIGDTVARSATENLSAFNSAAYVAGRGIGQLFNRGVFNNGV